MALPNRALRLTLLATLAWGGSQAQKITRADSVMLFRTAAKVTASNGGVVMTKGKVTHTQLRPDGKGGESFGSGVYLKVIQGEL